MNKKSLFVVFAVWLSCGMITFVNNSAVIVPGGGYNITTIYNITNNITQIYNITNDNNITNYVLNGDYMNSSDAFANGNLTVTNDIFGNNINLVYDVAAGVVFADYFIGNGSYLTDLPIQNITNNITQINNISNDYNITNNITNYVLNNDYVNSSNANVASNLNASKNVTAIWYLGQRITIGNTTSNINNAIFGSILGGDRNQVTGQYGIVGNGYRNTIGIGVSSNYDGIFSGYQNSIANSVASTYAVIAGGRQNNIEGGNYNGILSGFTNTMDTNSYSTQLGGNTNRVREGNYLVQLGGSDNWLGYGPSTYSLQFGKNIVQQYDDYTMIIGRDMWFNNDDDYYALGANISENNTARQFVVGFDDIDFRVNDSGIYSKNYGILNDGIGITKNITIVNATLSNCDLQIVGGIIIGKSC